MTRWLVVAIALMLAAGPPAARASQLTLVDLTDEFDAFWESSQGQPGLVRAAALRDRFAALLPGFFDARRAGVESAQYDAHLERAIVAYPRQREGVREVSRRFAGLFEPARQSFERAFGPVAMQRPIYLIHSLGEMDGGTRSLPGGTTLIFGADVIARYHLRHDIQPLVHHELFHVLHLRRFSNCGRVWCSLWIEGLATYAAKSLNPDATDAELLFEIPRPIRAAVEANRAEAVCAVVARLDSGDRADMRSLYSFEAMNERLPPRFGYYVGYLVAAELGRRRSMGRLATLRQQQVRPLVERTLRRLASCPAGTAA